MFHRIADGDGDGDGKAGCREISFHVVARVGYIPKVQYEGGSQLYQQQPKARLAAIIALQDGEKKGGEHKLTR